MRSSPLRLAAPFPRRGEIAISGQGDRDPPLPGRAARGAGVSALSVSPFVCRPRGGTGSVSEVSRRCLGSVSEVSREMHPSKRRGGGFEPAPELVGGGEDLHLSSVADHVEEDESWFAQHTTRDLVSQQGGAGPRRRVDCLFRPRAWWRSGRRGCGRAGTREAGLRERRRGRGGSREGGGKRGIESESESE